MPGLRPYHSAKLENVIGVKDSKTQRFKRFHNRKSCFYKIFITKTENFSPINFIN
jgi:hypothetical protein